MMAMAYKKGEASILLLLHLAYIQKNFSVLLYYALISHSTGSMSELKTPYGCNENHVKDHGKLNL